MIGLLFEYHCDPNKKNKNKKSAYDLCEGNPKLLQYLEQLYSKSKVVISYINLIFQENQANIIQNALDTPLQKNGQSNERESSQHFNEITAQFTGDLKSQK